MPPFMCVAYVLIAYGISLKWTSLVSFSANFPRGGRKKKEKKEEGGGKKEGEEREEEKIVKEQATTPQGGNDQSDSF